MISYIVVYRSLFPGFSFFFYLSFILLKNVYLKKKKGGGKNVPFALSHTNKRIGRTGFAARPFFDISNACCVCGAYENIKEEEPGRMR